MPDSAQSTAPLVYRAGWDAYIDCRGTGANPHEYGSPKWVAWREGYFDAEGEHIKELTDHGL